MMILFIKGSTSELGDYNEGIRGLVVSLYIWQKQKNSKKGLVDSWESMKNGPLRFLKIRIWRFIEEKPLFVDSDNKGYLRPIYL